jgi:hypothetical protein
MKRLLIVALLSFYANASYATHWLLVAESKDSTLLSFDTDSMIQDGDKRIFWQKIATKEVEKRDDGIEYDQIIAHQHLDCKADTVYQTSIEYKLHGIRVGHVINQRTPVRDVLPDSILKMAYVVIC